MIVLAVKKHWTDLIFQDFLYKELPKEQIVRCKIENLVETYQNIYDGNMNFDIVLTDSDDIILIDELHKINPQIKYIIIAGYDIDDELLVKAYKHGMFNFIRWPATKEQMLNILNS